MAHPVYSTFTKTARRTLSGFVASMHTHTGCVDYLRYSEIVTLAHRILICTATINLVFESNVHQKNYLMRSCMFMLGLHASAWRRKCKYIQTICLYESMLRFGALG